MDIRTLEQLKSEAKPGLCAICCRDLPVLPKKGKPHASRIFCEREACRLDYFRRYLFERRVRLGQVRFVFRPVASVKQAEIPGVVYVLLACGHRIVTLESISKKLGKSRRCPDCAKPPK